MRSAQRRRRRKSPRFVRLQCCCAGELGLGASVRSARPPDSSVGSFYKTLGHSAQNQQQACIRSAPGTSPLASLRFVESHGNRTCALRDTLHLQGGGHAEHVHSNATTLLLSADDRTPHSAGLQVRVFQTSTSASPPPLAPSYSCLALRLFRDFARGDVTPLKRASLSLTDSLAGQGERPLPFESNCEAIRNGPMAAFPRNTESLGSLLRGFFQVEDKTPHLEFPQNDKRTSAMPSLRCLCSWLCWVLCVQFYGSTLQNLSLSQDLPVEIDLFDASLRLGKQRLDVASLQRLRFHGRRRTKACQDEGGAALSLCRLPSCASLRTLPSGFSLQPESAEPPALVVRCPLTRCVVNRFSASAWRAIAEEFRRAERILAAQLPLECTYDRDGALPHRQRSRESGFRDKSL